ncbi:MAG: helix-turn-helix transcriptional regulator [Patescibacteria group bacterium]|jgi:transcriptional regulator with XRE-family HTH domain
MKVIRLPNLNANLKVVPDFGWQIQLARMECGLTQKELAEMLGHTTTWLSLIESGKRGISVTGAWQISQVTNKPIVDLLRL